MPQTTAQTRHVLIVDDHPLVRDGLTLLITREEDLAICGEAESIAEALPLFGQLQPDVAIVDLSLKDGNGLELIKQVAANELPTRMLVVSMHDEDIYAERALHAGAMGYVDKHEASEKIVNAIRRVLEGKYYVSDHIASRMFSQMTKSGTQAEKSPVERLTDRELEVFELIGDGLSMQQIAERLELSPKTVETYRGRMKKKLDIDSAQQLTHYAVRWVSEHTER